MSAPHQLRRVRLRAKNTKSCLNHTWIRYRPFQDGGSDVVLCCLSLLVSELRWCFTLCLFIILLVRFWLLSGHLLGNSCALDWPFLLIVFCLFVFYLFSHLGFKSECHHNARARGDQPGFRRWQPIERQKMKFVLSILRFFSLRNEIVKVI